MDSRVSVISININDAEAAGAVNDLLHEFRQYEQFGYVKRRNFNEPIF